jgi:hypothetical protein
VIRLGWDVGPSQRCSCFVVVGIVGRVDGRDSVMREIERREQRLDGRDCKRAKVYSVYSQLFFFARKTRAANESY